MTPRKYISKPLLIDLAQHMYAVAKDHVDLGAPNRTDVGTGSGGGSIDPRIVGDTEIYTSVADLSEKMVREVGVGVRSMSPNILQTAIMLQSSDGHAQLIGLCRWAHAAFPSISMGHKYAAALLVTNASKEAVDLVRPPFPTFLIEVPEGLLFLDGNKDQGGTSPITHVLVYQLQSNKVASGWTWGYTAYSSAGLSVFRYGVLASELLPPELDDVLDGNRKQNDDRTLFSFDLTDADKRTTAMIGRLIINTCLAFSDPTNVRSRETRQRHHINSHFKGRKSDEPTVRNFVLGKPVKHDFRDHVAAFVRGDRKAPPSVQVLVCGHHKTQHYGTKNSLVKVIWVEPYWKGPEDAPIPIRPHTIIGEP
jgi:hypothetical protein